MDHKGHEEGVRYILLQGSGLNIKWFSRNVNRLVINVDFTLKDNHYFLKCIIDILREEKKDQIKGLFKSKEERQEKKITAMIRTDLKTW